MYKGKDIKVVSFYSYKGGVGRSLAISFISQYLAYNGYLVYLLDFDLEAPGASFKFLKDIHNHDEITNEGVVDLLHDTRFWPSRKSLDNYLYQKNILHNTASNNDLLNIMPAGKELLRRNYIKKVFKLTRRNFFAGGKMAKRLRSIITMVQEEMQKKINQNTRIKGGLIFIDSRAGITPFNVMTNVELPIQIINFVANIEESYIGSTEVHLAFKNTIKKTEKKIDIITVLSRIPTPSNWFEAYKEHKQVNKLIDIATRERLEIQNNDVVRIRSNKKIEYDENLFLFKSFECNCSPPCDTTVCRNRIDQIHIEHISLANKIISDMDDVSEGNNIKSMVDLKTYFNGNKIIGIEVNNDLITNFIEQSCVRLFVMKFALGVISIFHLEIDNKSVCINDGGTTANILKQYNCPNVYADYMKIIQHYDVSLMENSEKIFILHHTVKDNDNNIVQDATHRFCKCLSLLFKYTELFIDKFNVYEYPRNSFGIVVKHGVSHILSNGMDFKFTNLSIKYKNDYFGFYDFYKAEEKCKEYNCQNDNCKKAECNKNVKHYIYSDITNIFLNEQFNKINDYIKHIGKPDELLLTLNIPSVNYRYINAVLLKFDVKYYTAENNNSYLLKQINKDEDSVMRDLFECMLFFETLPLFYQFK